MNRTFILNANGSGIAAKKPYGTAGLLDAATVVSTKHYVAQGISSRLRRNAAITRW
ncbi:hypothetical protein ABI_06550 [Asticcacaulis biprosthecium C19]|uniref:Uncharacterized protein n=1 Tax=Asticcacaulis biprosthecium C19 TaxID=715226 RepID=F4QKZ8_9CAUL|nr:hypothetical protein ABI_06550 [Asticcacaulis biprosthecium C19]